VVGPLGQAALALLGQPTQQRWLGSKAVYSLTWKALAQAKNRKNGFSTLERTGWLIQRKDPAHQRSAPRRAGLQHHVATAPTGTRRIRGMVTAPTERRGRRLLVWTVTEPVAF